MTYRTILLPLDGSPQGERALPYAARLAAASGATLVLLEVAFAHLVTRNGPGGGPPRTVDTAREYLDGLAARLQGQVAVETVETRGEPGEQIVAACSRLEADLIAMAPYGSSGFGRWLYGGTADHVLGHAGAPVLLIPPTGVHAWEDPSEATAPPPGGTPRRILVPLDGSEAALAALDPAGAGDLAEALDAGLLLLCAVTADGQAGRGGPPGSAGGGTEATHDPGAARAYLEESAAALRDRGQQVDVLVVPGPPAATIAGVARERGAEAIVMAARRRGGLAGLVAGVTGGVVEETLRRAPVPLLLVRPAVAGLPDDR